jgi:carbonic anhydrase/acetyltransferase-like protein (isoleucine patch superfamily)
MAACRTFTLGEHVPQLHETVWIAPSAVVLGNVSIGANSGIWFNCVLRGDAYEIRIGSRTNVQDGTIIHVDPGPMSANIGDDVTIGHQCIIHGCSLLDGAFVGMGATVMNGAVIEGSGMLAAGALLTSGRRITAGELWAGRPAKLLRAVTPEERNDFLDTARHYVRNAEMFKRLLRPTPTAES